MKTEQKFRVSDLISKKLPWSPEKIPDLDMIPTGDMPGEKVRITASHEKKAEILFPGLLKLIIHALDRNLHQRVVIAVCGGSGVGKSGIASLISFYLNALGVGSYTLSGDNYPHRIPKYNDAERLHIFRKSGIDGLKSYGLYNEEVCLILRELQENGNDSDPEYINKYPWFSVYLGAGGDGLRNYLGTPAEIDFKELTGIISQFKNGESKIFLKRMGRTETDLWYDMVDFSDKNILIIEWTHGNSHYLQGVDIPVLLNSTPEETLEYRRSRNRDDSTDSPFTTMVLTIEQDMLISQASRAKIILSKSGEILSYKDFMKLMVQDRI